MVLFLQKLLSILLLSWPLVAAAQTTVHHDLQVSLKPEQGRIAVEDLISFAENAVPQPLCWTLQAGLRPALLIPEKAELRPEEGEGGGQQRQRFCVELPPHGRQIKIRYAGPVLHPQLPIGQGSAPISAAGVYLDSASNWYPEFAGERVTFRLELELPSHWSSISQGRRQAPHENKNKTSKTEIWQENQPQQAIYLIAGDFQVYEKTAHMHSRNAVQLLAFLRTAEPELAGRYLDATEDYLSAYSQLLGPYPYAKFALVENFWESGYGMPSFTLLGPRVLRLPFILESSYPHEILHSWWGSGVYLEPGSGNWSEGLATYLGDYLLKEQQNEGMQFRRSAVQRYNNYLLAGRDFPLSRFGIRSDDAAQAVGYDKGMMFFHMLRLQLGDRAFIDGLRRFYQNYRFKPAGFAQLQASFEQVSGRSLKAHFRQWLERTGAPQLVLADIEFSRRFNRYRLSATLHQSQPGPAYRLRIPVAVQLAGAQAWQTSLLMAGKTLRFSINVPERPQRLAIDPEFDLLRRLDRAEVPPSLNRLFTARRTLLVLPAAAARQQRRIYQQIADDWSQGSDTLVRWDDKLAVLPSDRNIWLFGWENRFVDQFMERLQAQPVSLRPDAMRLQNDNYKRTDFGAVLVAHAAGGQNSTLGWLAWDDPQGLEWMARKLRHYGKYSYLVFTGHQGQNVVKGQWAVTASPLNIAIEPGAPRWRARLAPRPALMPGHQ